MSIPIRCFTCGSITGDKWERYQEYRKTMSKKDSLDKLKLTRLCCRRIIMTHVDNEDDMLKHSKERNNTFIRPG